MLEKHDVRTASFFPASRVNALSRLDTFLPQMAETYAEERNSDYGPEDRSNISCLSPFHAHRLLTEQETIARALDEHGFERAEKFIQEVYWRTYFKGWLEQRPWVWTRYRSAVKQAIEGLAGDKKEAFENAITGNTDIECMNAWTREVVDTGYLHNHSRMWFASIWIFTLKLPWELGADFFYRHLLDGDAASNTLSWRWVAGLHTVGKNYSATAANIRRFTEGRFDPVGQLSIDPAPLEDDWNGLPEPLTFAEAPSRGKKTILLLHEDDCGWNSLDLEGLDLAAVAGMTVTDDRSPYGASELAKKFAIESVEDALNTSDDGLPVDAVKLASPSSLEDLAKETNAEQVAYPYAPVGPVRDRLDAAATSWRQAGLSVAQILRPFDKAVWPHCTKGFFHVKNKIPDLLESL